MATYIRKDKNTVENTVKKFGYTAARLSVPMAWLGKRCRITLLDTEEQEKQASSTVSNQ